MKKKLQCISLLFLDKIDLGNTVFLNERTQNHCVGFYNLLKVEDFEDRRILRNGSTLIRTIHLEHRLLID